MRVRTPFKVATVAAVIALLASACGGQEGEEPGDTTGQQGGELRVYLSEPDSLLPTEASDSESIQVIRLVYRGLTRSNLEGEIELDLAESIETADNITWTITVKQGYTFTNGEPVNADAFLRAWNYAGYGPNAQDNSYFMSRIAGFAEMQADPPEAEEFSGLTKVDDFTFTVELSAPFAGLPAILDYSGFAPLAEECLADAEACTETPIGNGQYTLEGEWEHDVQIVLVRNESYAGDDPGNADRIINRIFEAQDAAYAAFQGGELDIIDATPPERRSEARSLYSDGFYEVPSTTFTFLGFPHYDERFQDPRVRQAFSMAIDRQAIIDAVLDGGATPATGVVSPLFDGAREGICEFCQYNPDLARELLDEAGWDGSTVTMIANAGAGHDAWMQAAGDQLNQNLGVEYELDVSQQFAEYLDTLTNDEAPGPYRLAWGPDYPVLETYLYPLYGTGTDSNFGRYSNPEFDQLIAMGDQAPSLADAIPFYQQAEDIVVEEIPAIPLWFGITSSVYDTDTVEEFVYNNIHGIDYAAIVVAGN
jgi:ABC-type transport system substrate-binding protein